MRTCGRASVPPEPFYCATSLGSMPIPLFGFQSRGTNRQLSPFWHDATGLGGHEYRQRHCACSHLSARERWHSDHVRAGRVRNQRARSQPRFKFSWSRLQGVMPSGIRCSWSKCVATQLRRSRWRGSQPRVVKLDITHPVGTTQGRPRHDLWTKLRSFRTL
jgi:hypothetical protein